MILNLFIGLFVICFMTGLYEGFLFMKEEAERTRIIHVDRIITFVLILVIVSPYTALCGLDALRVYIPRMMKKFKAKS